MRLFSLLVTVLSACGTVATPDLARPHGRGALEPAEVDPQRQAGGSGPEPSPVAVATARQTVPAATPFPNRVASVAFDVQVHLAAGTEVAGFVLDRDGRPVKRACVELGGPGTGTSGPRPAPIFTTSQGDFRFPGVPPGTVRITITVEDLEPLAERRIPDYHHQDPNLAVLLRPLVVNPGGGKLTVPWVKRQGDLPGQAAGGAQWIEVAPLALRAQGYSPACRRALRAPAVRPKSRTP